MPYLCADCFGTHISDSIPKRKLLDPDHEWVQEGVLGFWVAPNMVNVPRKTPKLFFEQGYLLDCRIPLDKRDMNFGDNPIAVDITSI